MAEAGIGLGEFPAEEVLDDGLDGFCDGQVVVVVGGWGAVDVDAEELAVLGKSG